MTMFRQNSAGLGAIRNNVALQKKVFNSMPVAYSKKTRPALSHISKTDISSTKKLVPQLNRDISVKIENILEQAMVAMKLNSSQRPFQTSLASKEDNKITYGKDKQMIIKPKLDTTTDLGQKPNW